MLCFSSHMQLCFQLGDMQETMGTQEFGEPSKWNQWKQWNKWNQKNFIVYLFNC